MLTETDEECPGSPDWGQVERLNERTRQMAEELRRLRQLDPRTLEEPFTI